jgi:hypothetical protein
MKGSAITGPVGKEAAELWPVSATMVSCMSSLRGTNTFVTAYRLQLWCCDVSGCLLRETVHSGGVRAAFYAQASSMISCHEGTSSQTIFFRRNKTPPQPCAWKSRTTTTTYDAKGTRHFLAARDIPATWHCASFPVLQRCAARLQEPQTATEGFQEQPVNEFAASQR